MRRASTWSGMGTAALIALASLSAVAQTAAAPKSGAPAPAKAPNTQAKLPYDVTADQQEVFNDEHRTVYRGNVVAIQGTDRLNTPELTIISAKKDPATTKAPPPGAPASAANTFGKIERMEAAGPVYFNTPTQNAKGDHGTYVAADDTITLTGNVVLVQNKDVSTGDKLIYQKGTGHAQLYSKAGAAPERVRGVFYQDDAPAPAAGPNAAAPAKGAAAPAKPAPKPKTKGKTSP